MHSWHTTYLSLKELPRELSAFELQAFFAFSRAERAVIDARHGATHKLGLALHMGFLRLSGRSQRGTGRARLAVGPFGEGAWCSRTGIGLPQSSVRTQKYSFRAPATGRTYPGLSRDDRASEPRLCTSWI